MRDIHSLLIERTITVVALAVVLLAGATTADAQYREGRWEFSLGTFYQLGTEVEAENGSTIDTSDDFGFTLGGGYNFSDRLATTFAFQWAGVGYDATGMDEDGNDFDIRGKYDSFTLSANLVLNLADGPFVPYVGAGIGWTWIDTNIPSGPPTTGCWWDPWWGYVCYSSYPTETTDAFSYQALLGIRYEFDNDRTFLRLGYTSQWMDFSSASGTPRFDVIVLDIGWMF
ncbi:MAG: porin family protein [Acidobacteria bacterium]|nr:porin family protein [Candidatus Sulfomarinibacter kjeldsenii]